MLIDRRSLLLGSLAVTVLVARARRSDADEPAPGYILTGAGIRVKHVGPFTVNVYGISHFMRRLPAVRTKQAVIDAEVDKNFTWNMLRELDAPRIRTALEEAFALNGYTDAAKIGQFVGVFTHPIAKGSTVGITYLADRRSTTIAVQGDGTATVPGADFMHATWSIWFGKIDQPELSDALLSKMPSA